MPDEIKEATVGVVGEPSKTSLVLSSGNSAKKDREERKKRKEEKEREEKEKEKNKG
jgi:hypothetical protein